ncbi:hypothetical protein V490_05948 [Pseudogymnoascus sp. VKM F-3557]|nr:hypothetical protein V490_05948 [Pseudogymnoascus sp. VKM F-3557]
MIRTEAIQLQIWKTQPSCDTSNITKTAASPNTTPNTTPNTHAATVLSISTLGSTPTIISKTNYTPPAFQPICYVPGNKEAEIRSCQVQEISAVAHDLLDGGGNHWCFYLQISGTQTACLDMAPTHTVPSTILPNGSKGNMIISMLPDRSSISAANIVQLDVCAGLTVSPVVDLLIQSDRSKYEFNSESRGCRMWTTDQIALFERQGIITNSTQAEEARNAILREYPSLRPFPIDLSIPPSSPYHFSPLNAQYHLRAGPPLPTAPPLFIRQQETCDTAQTLCNDGSGDCCPIGSACTTVRGVPACAGGCGVADTICTGVLDGLCCDFGYTCNYVSTNCVKNTLGPPYVHPIPTIVIPTPIIIPTPIVVPSPIVVPTPIVPTPIVVPSPIIVRPSSSSEEEEATEVTSFTETGPNATLPSGPEETTSSPTIASTPTESTPTESTTTESTTTESTPAESTPTESTPTQTTAGNGQQKLGVDLKVLLAGCGLAFLWAY